MKDKANVCMGNFGKSNQDIHTQLLRVFFLIQNDGSNLPFMVQNAINEGYDWCNPGRLNAIIYDKILEDMAERDNGIGIHHNPESGEEVRTIYINHDNMTVIIDDNVWTFREFCKLSIANEISKWW